MQSNRRNFLKKLSLLTLAPLLRPQLLFGSENEAINKSQPILIFIYLRGAQDGLSVISPIGEENYYKWRPNIALKKQGAENIEIDNHFLLNPATKALKKYWVNKNLAYITEFGSTNPTRSHFDAQDFMESGSPGLKNIEDGFFNRALSKMKKTDMMTAMAIQDSMPRSLKGKNPTISMASLKDFQFPNSEISKNISMGFEEMYQQATDKVFRGIGGETFDSLNKIKARIKQKSVVEYPKNKLGNDLKDIASIINSELGLSIAVTEMGGWDTHVNQGSSEGQFTKRLEEFSESVDAFIQDIGHHFSSTLIVAITEFGRTAKENGNKGTDHGHGSVGFILGNQINGGKLYGNWSGLDNSKLYEERDIPVTTDYRDLMSVILSKHLNISDLAGIFPDFTPNEKALLNLWRV